MNYLLPLLKGMTGVGLTSKDLPDLTKLSISKMELGILKRGLNGGGGLQAAELVFPTPELGFLLAPDTLLLS